MGVWARIGGTPLQAARYVLVLVCVVVLAMGMFRQIVPQAFNGPDFQNAYTAASDIRHGQNPYASAAEFINAFKPGDLLENHLDFFTYAPAYAILLIPFTFLPYKAALAIWGACIAGFLVLAIYSVWRSMGRRPTPMLMLVMVTVASLSTAVRAEVFLGQANLFMLVCIVVAVWARLERRTVLAGLLLSVAFATKPTWLLLAVFLLWKREFRLVFVAIPAFCALLLLPFVWLGAQSFGDLLTMWKFFSTYYLTFTENIAPRGILERLFVPNPFVHPVLVAPWLSILSWYAITGMLILVCLSLVRPCPVQRDPLLMLELGAMLCTMLLISPLTEPPYLVYLLVPLVAIVGYVRDGVIPVRRTRLVIMATVVAVCILQTVPRSAIEPFVWARAIQGGPLAGMYAILAVSQFYIVLLLYVLQIRVLSLASGRPLAVALGTLIKDSPQIVLEWLHDFLVAANLPGRQQVGRWRTAAQPVLDLR